MVCSQVYRSQIAWLFFKAKCMCTRNECIQLVDSIMSRLDSQEKKALVWDPGQRCLRVLTLKSKTLERLLESEQKRCVEGTFDNRANYLDVLQALQATLEGINKR